MASDNFYCYKCGTELTDGTVFCYKCGTKMPAEIRSAVSADGTAAKVSNRTVMIIVICVAVVILGILGTVLAIVLSNGGGLQSAQSSDLSGNNGGFSVQQDKPSDFQQNLDNIEFVASTSTHFDYPELAAGQAIVTLTEKNSGKQVDPGTVSTYFTSGNGFDVFCVTMTKDSNDMLIIGGALNSNICHAGSYFQDSGLKSERAFIDLVFLGIDNNGYYTDKCYEHTSYSNPDDLKNCTLDIGNYTAKSEATYYIKTDYTFNGVEYTLESFCRADYTASAQDVQQAQIQQYQQEQASGVCTVCHGSGICQVCYGRGGMSYATYGQGGSGWVDCESCKGNRVCKYCSGTGRG